MQPPRRTCHTTTPSVRPLGGQHPTQRRHRSVLSIAAGEAMRSHGCKSCVEVNAETLGDHAKDSIGSRARYLARALAVWNRVQVIGFLCRAAAGFVSCRAGVHDWMAGRNMQQGKELGQWLSMQPFTRTRGEEGHGFNAPRPEAGASSLPAASAYIGISAPSPTSSPSAIGTAFVTLAAARAAPPYAVQRKNNRVRIMTIQFTALHCITQHSTAQHNTAKHSTVIHAESGLPLACWSPNIGTAYMVREAVELSCATITCVCLWNQTQDSQQEHVSCWQNDATRHKATASLAWEGGWQMMAGGMPENNGTGENMVQMLC